MKEFFDKFNQVHDQVDFDQSKWREVEEVSAFLFDSPFMIETDRWRLLVVPDGIDSQVKCDCKEQPGLKKEVRRVAPVDWYNPKIGSSNYLYQFHSKLLKETDRFKQGGLLLVIGPLGKLLFVAQIKSLYLPADNSLNIVSPLVSKMRSFFKNVLNKGKESEWLDYIE